MRDERATVLGLPQLAAAAAAGIRVAVAESLTGGLLADAFVAVPGSSRVFLGAVVAYDTNLKQLLLGVDGALLQQRGPVDAEVARQMARGVRYRCAVPRSPAGQRLPAEIGLATTGVAGPDPDPATGQPAGTVWLGISSELGERSVRLQLVGDREHIRRETVRAAAQEFTAEVAALGEVHTDHPARSQET